MCIEFFRFYSDINITWRMLKCHIFASIMNTNVYEYNGVGSVPKDVVHALVNDGVVLIPDETFHECHNLESIIIPDSVTKIGQEAFRNCKSIVTINLPPSIKKLVIMHFFIVKNFAISIFRMQLQRLEIILLVIAKIWKLLIFLHL